MAFINGGISEFYHPMAALGDRMHSARTKSINIPIGVSLAMFALWVWHRPLTPRFYVLGMVPLGLAAALPFLPRVESGYEQSFWLGDQRHKIPWVYGPYNGQSQRGGDYFFVRVLGAELTPYYQNDQDLRRYFTLGKTVGFGNGNGDRPSESGCDTDQSNFRCAWTNDDYVYSLSGNVDVFPEDPQALFQPIEALLDSFAVATP